MGCSKTIRPDDVVTMLTAVVDSTTGALVDADPNPIAQVIGGSATVSITKVSTGVYKTVITETGGDGNSFIVTVTGAYNECPFFDCCAYDVLERQLSDADVDCLIAKLLTRNLCKVECHDCVEGHSLHSLAAAIMRLTGDQALWADCDGVQHVTIPGACDTSAPYGSVSLSVNKAGKVKAAAACSSCGEPKTDPYMGSCGCGK